MLRVMKEQLQSLAQNESKKFHLKFRDKIGTVDQD